MPDDLRRSLNLPKNSATLAVGESVAHLSLEKLRQRIDCLEEVQRRFSRTISIARPVDQWLPFGGLPTGCIHEVKAASFAGAIVFSAILSARIAQDQGNILYIAPDKSFYPLGLLPYGVNLNRLLYVSAQRQNLLWAVMEALRCSQVSSVMAFVDRLDLTGCRKLQLAAENNGTTAFLLNNGQPGAIAAPISRWQIHSVKGSSGRRFNEPVWDLELLYSRGGRPGKWILEWRGCELVAHLRSPAQPSRNTGKALAG